MEKVVFTQLNDQEFRHLIKDVLTTHFKGSSTQSTSTNPSFLNIREAAKYLHISVQTLRSKVRSGQIKVHQPDKILYFSTSDLNDYIEGRIPENNLKNRRAKS